MQLQCLLPAPAFEALRACLLRVHHSHELGRVRWRLCQQHLCCQHLDLLVDLLQASPAPHFLPIALQRLMSTSFYWSSVSEPLPALAVAGGCSCSRSCSLSFRNFAICGGFRSLRCCSSDSSAGVRAGGLELGLPHIRHCKRRNLLSPL